jgi:hypothetical protein
MFIWSGGVKLNPAATSGTSGHLYQPRMIYEHGKVCEMKNYYLLILLNWTANGFSLGEYHTTLKKNTAHKATQTMKDTLHTTNTTQKK